MKNKFLGLLIMFIVYSIAIVAGIFVFLALANSMNHYLAIFIADVVGTVIVYLSGVLFKTASMYDPYWSVQSVIIYSCLLSFYHNWNIGTIIVLIAMTLYSIRLTVNFIIGFDSLKYVDWRYRMLKEKSGKLYQLVNFLGICMFPTCVVYLASVPLFYYAKVGSFSYFNLIGVGVILLGVLLELISDIQMKKFVKIRTSRSDIIDFGLWKYSRHPNYLGEIIIWFGVALIILISYPEVWFFLLGAVVNLVMFLVISIPMEENHFKDYKPTYEEYKKKTSMLLILPRRR